LNEVSLTALGTTLFFLIILSGFFSSSETGMMSLNRYRLRHRAQSGKKPAQRIEALLKRPDRLIGVILIGNNFVNILASSITTVIALRLLGDSGIAWGTAILTLVILIFAEVTPKTLAVLHPERIAYPASYVLIPLLKIFYPLVWLVNSISNSLLWLLRVKRSGSHQGLSPEELRTVVYEAGARMPSEHQRMLLSILDLEKISVDDIMIPRNEVVGIDIDDSLASIVKQLKVTQHTRMPIFKGELNQTIGVLHVRNATRFMDSPDLNKAMILQQSGDPYFVLEGTPLDKQLVDFQHNKRRIGLVVDEYGEVQGIVTLEDILEEIVGEFTTDMAATSKDIHPQKDGSFLIDGTATIRDINRALKWDMPIAGPKTLNGIIIEALESIPENSVCTQIGNYRIETLHTQKNIVKTARVFQVSAPKQQAS